MTHCVTEMPLCGWLKSSSPVGVSTMKMKVTSSQTVTSWLPQKISQVSSAAPCQRSAERCCGLDQFDFHGVVYVFVGVADVSGSSKLDADSATMFVSSAEGSDITE